MVSEGGVCTFKNLHYVPLPKFAGANSAQPYFNSPNYTIKQKKLHNFCLKNNKKQQNSSKFHYKSSICLLMLC